MPLDLASDEVKKRIATFQDKLLPEYHVISVFCRKRLSSEIPPCQQLGMITNMDKPANIQLLMKTILNNQINKNTQTINWIDEKIDEFYIAG